MEMAAEHASSRYGPGMELHIRSHIPPPPFGKDYKNEDAIRTRAQVLDRDVPTDRLEFALHNPPLETLAPDKAKSRILVIDEKLDHRRERGGGPHVVRCHLKSDDSNLYVAKIYDGMDYPLEDHAGYDCMYLADRDYSRETAAYRAMPLSLQGSAVPRYYGSWTFSLETGMSGRLRSIRLILIEFICGESMLDMILRAKGVTSANGSSGDHMDLPIDYGVLPSQQERLDVLACVIETEIALFHAGILHLDIAPRNVLICMSTKRVALIDFNNSAMYKYYEVGRRYLETRDPKALPMSPVERCWNSSMVTEFDEWMPREWLEDRDRNLFLNWLCERWGMSTKYAPLSEKFLRRRGDHPLLKELQLKRSP